MRRVLAFLTAVAAVGGIAACGSGQTDVSASESPMIRQGAQIFSTRCQGCHNLAVVNAVGGATKVRDRERVDGPNFNVRKEVANNVLYAIRNGGFSGAIMPQNIVVGEDANAVAAFLQKYSGLKAKKTIDPNS